MCNECNHKHMFGYRCPCKCHQPIDKTIIERDKRKHRKEGEEDENAKL